MVFFEPSIVLWFGVSFPPPSSETYRVSFLCLYLLETLKKKKSPFEMLPNRVLSIEVLL